MVTQDEVKIKVTIDSHTAEREIKKINQSVGTIGKSFQQIGQKVGQFGFGSLVAAAAALGGPIAKDVFNIASAGGAAVGRQTSRTLGLRKAAGGVEAAEAAQQDVIGALGLGAAAASPEQIHALFNQFQKLRDIGQAGEQKIQAVTDIEILGRVTDIGKAMAEAFRQAMGIK